MLVQASDRETFWRLGYLPLGPVAEPSLVTGLCREFERITSARNPLLPADHVMRSQAGDHVRVGLHLCHVNETFRRFALDASVAARMRALFGCDVAVLTSLLFNKPAGRGEPLALHQDLPYYPYLGDDDLITCWTALDPVGPCSGPVQYLTGSHRVRVEHRRTGKQQALDINPASVDSPLTAPMTLGAGEAIAHHGLTVHRSSPNSSGHSRRGLATLYIRADVKVTRSDFPYPPLIPPGPTPA